MEGILVPQCPTFYLLLPDSPYVRFQTKQHQKTELHQTLIRLLLRVDYGMKGSFHRHYHFR